jgi:hypothetical protein
MSTSFKHVTNTWLVAQLIHPFMFYGFIVIIGWDWIDFSYVPLLLFFGFFFSLGGYMFCALLFQLICLIRLSIGQKFFLWIITMMISIMAGAYLTCLLLFNSKTFFEIILLIVPGLLAAVIAASIWFKQFFSVVDFLSEDYSE